MNVLLTECPAFI